MRVHKSYVRHALAGVVALVVLPMAIMTGCATDTETMRAAYEAQSKQRPTLAVTCPAGGCSVEYTDPRDRQIKLPTSGYDAAIAISGQITGLVGAAVVPAAMGAVAVRGFDALHGSGQVTTTNTTTTTDSHASTVDSHAVDSHAVTTDSHATDSHAATSPPTVVTQPAPIVVVTP